MTTTQTPRRSHTGTDDLALEDMYALSVVQDPKLSPDGRQVAAVIVKADRDTDTNVSRIWHMDSSGLATARPLTTGPNDAVPRWSPDGDWLAFLAARGGPPQLHLLPIRGGGEPCRLTDLPLGITDAQWSPDSQRLLTLAIVDPDSHIDPQSPRVTDRLDYKIDGTGWTGAKRVQLFVLSRDGGAIRQLPTGDTSVNAAFWSPDGETIAYLAASSQPDRDLTLETAAWLIAADGGPATRLTPPGWLASQLAWSPDGTSLLLTGTSTPRIGHTQLYTVPVAGGSPELVARIDRNIMIGGAGYPGAPPQWLPDGRILFCVRNGGGVHVLSTELGAAPAPIVAGDDIVVSGLHAHAGQLAYIAAASDSPSELYVADIDTGASRRLTSLFATDLTRVRLRTPEHRTFTGSDGHHIDGWLLRADGEGPHPVLVDIHGGPHNAWGPTFDGVHMYHQTLTAAGWHVLLVNPRGSDGYGEEFYTAVTGGWGIRDETDIHDALDALVVAGVADPDRLVVTGYSYGGYLSCWLSARSARFRAAIPGGALVNLTSAAGTSDLGPHMARLEFGDNPAVSSPITHVDQVGAPTLILHGEADERCPKGQAEEWFAALRTRGVDVQMVHYPGASHLFPLNGRPSHRLDYCRRVHDWTLAHG